MLTKDEINKKAAEIREYLAKNGVSAAMVVFDNSSTMTTYANHEARLNLLNVSKVEAMALDMQNREQAKRLVDQGTAARSKESSTYIG